MGYRLVLWDVDMTLVACGPIGREITAEAFHELTGTVQRERPPYAGRTEAQILAHTLRLHGLDPAGYPLADYTAALVRGYRRRHAELAATGCVLPGVVQALDAITAAGVPQSVVTGNPREVAAAKLSAFGLDAALELDRGGYAEDGEHRRDLVRAAISRARPVHGGPLAPGEVLVVGDTPNDVRAAHALGAASLAVVTGFATQAELAAERPEALLPDLSDTAAVLSLVTAGAPGTEPAATGGDRLVTGHDPDGHDPDETGPRRTPPDAAWGDRVRPVERPGRRRAAEADRP